MFEETSDVRGLFRYRLLNKEVQRAWDQTSQIRTRRVKPRRRGLSLPSARMYNHMDTLTCRYGAFHTERVRTDKHICRIVCARIPVCLAIEQQLLISRERRVPNSKSHSIRWRFCVLWIHVPPGHLSEPAALPVTWRNRAARKQIERSHDSTACQSECQHTVPRIRTTVGIVHGGEKGNTDTSAAPTLLCSFGDSEV
ncbi:hypothetical protein KUCAC02_031678 [Chaenocephalus aceratus]|nr:hypothetical protein KUCAC02_031678 [Chaenocephalus aceratus]